MNLEILSLNFMTANHKGIWFYYNKIFSPHDFIAEPLVKLIWYYVILVNISFTQMTDFL